MALQGFPSAGVGIFRPARPGRHHRSSSSLSVRVMDLLQHVAAAAAAHRSGRRPSAPILLALPACRLVLSSSPAPAPACQLVLLPSSARAASLPAGPAPSGPGRVARQPAPAPGLPFTVRTLVGLLASSSRPGGSTGARVCVCAGRITNEPAQTPRLPVGPSCRAAWARNPRGAESRLIAHALNEAHLVYSASPTVSSQLDAAGRTKKRLESKNVLCVTGINSTAGQVCTLCVAVVLSSWSALDLII